MKRTKYAVTQIVLNLKPEGKGPRDRPQKKWTDVVEKDLKNLLEHIIGVR